MILLAAGESRRMQCIKQLLPWKDSTLIEHAINQAQSSIVETIFVVLGANLKIIKNEILNKNIIIIDNNNWELGMGSSINSALNFIKENSYQFDALLIALADQPLIGAEHINEMIFKYYDQSKNIIATQLKNGAGVPAIFGSNYFEKLANLYEDRGAKEIIKKNQDDLYTISIEFYKIKDIDTKEEYEIVFNKYGKL